MSVTMEYRSGVLSRVDVMVAKVVDVKVATEQGVESIAFETMDGTAIRVYGSPGFLAAIGDKAIDALGVAVPA